MKQYACITEDEFYWLKEFYEINRTEVTNEQQLKLRTIHNKVYKTNLKQTSCPSCVKELMSNVKQIYTSYDIQ